MVRLDRVVFQIKAIDDRGRFRRMHVNMNHFVQPVERAGLEEGFQSAIGRHGLMMGLLDGGVRVSSSDAEMPAGGGVPPELQCVRVVLPQINVNV